jgi:phosphoribosyl 1,2-cyclic phosphodiesterase
MECSAKSIDDVVVVSVSGRVDHKSSREFEAVLKPHLDVCIAGDRRKMVIDLAGVDYMSSAGFAGADDGSQDRDPAQGPDRRGRIAADHRGSVPDQPLQPGSPGPPIGAGGRRRTGVDRGSGGRQHLAQDLPRQVVRGKGMRVRFWGTRGSLPVAADGAAIRRKIKEALAAASGRRFDAPEAIDRFIDRELRFPVRSGYGGRTSCLQIEGGDTYLLLDMGSGLRAFGQHVMQQQGPQDPQVYHFLMSHSHWDHIMGFPFFPPAYIPGNTIHIHGGHPPDMLQEVFRRQQSNPVFPVYWEQLGAEFHFHHFKTGPWHDLNGFRIKSIRQRHHGGSFGYRIEKGGKSLVYSTDGEHKQESEAETEAVVDFYRGADLVIFDAMYSMADMITIREDWGHSSNIVGVDLCQRAGVKHYCMFHHEPAHDDDTIQTILEETIRYEEIVRDGAPMTVTSAYDGLEIDL